MKKGDILNIDGYAVVVGAHSRNILKSFYVAVKDNVMTVHFAKNYTDEQVIEKLKDCVEELVTQHNDARHFPKFTYEDGSEVTVLGEKYTLRWKTVMNRCEQGHKNVSMDANSHEITIPMCDPSAKNAKWIFLSFLEELLYDFFRKRFFYWCDRMKLRPDAFEFFHNPVLWGKCDIREVEDEDLLDDPDDDEYLETVVVKYNTLLLTQEMRYIDETIVHELCHMFVLGHEMEFYHELEQYIPDFREINPPKIVRTLPREAN